MLVMCAVDKQFSWTTAEQTSLRGAPPAVLEPWAPFPRWERPVLGSAADGTTIGNGLVSDRHDGSKSPVQIKEIEKKIFPEGWWGVSRNAPHCGFRFKVKKMTGPEKGDLVALQGWLHGLAGWRSTCSALGRRLPALARRRLPS
jgi:hypothetical protein